MTRDEMKQRLDVASAWVDGSEVWVSRSGENKFTPFLDEAPDFFSDRWDWKRKPEPKLRPWKPEEVPVGALIRTKGNEFKWRALIGYVGADGRILGGGNVSVSCDFAFSNHEHSLDNGKTWKPCGVEEAQ